jgi:hypothetical protein
VRSVLLTGGVGTVAADELTQQDGGSTGSGSVDGGTNIETNPPGSGAGGGPGAAGGGLPTEQEALEY